MHLKKGCETAAVFDFTLHLGWFNAGVPEIVQESLLPYSWKHMSMLQDKAAIIRFMENWIRQRCIPDYRSNLDIYVQNAIHVHAPGFGRMFGHQYIPAALSFFLSAFDQYSLVPEKDEILFFGLEDMRFERLYNLCPEAREGAVLTEEDVLVTEPYRKLYKPFRLNYNTTIHSGFPSWIEKRGEKLYLKQKNLRHMEYERLLLEAVSSWKYRLEGDALLTMDITGIGDGEIIWLQDLIPYLKRGEPIQEQLAELSGEKEAINAIFEVNEKTSTKTKELSLSECAIVKVGGETHPLIIA